MQYSEILKCRSCGKSCKFDYSVNKRLAVEHSYNFKRINCFKINC